ncbi:helix-turn-helix transcriptional regulator [Sphingomonas sp. H39-1-10]|uniref:helix-turn-helix transcriptional regulator n=1 Tax=Sphingomonas pollutisoli TaxID=3030829 RepID=UPI0023BA15EC|nr:helix-turn-helix transcriptional regulator [Sphingomonas pollutisoli]MDF0490362.1 helix-turn-helix transcriptional regulator [Sphingomonas pollutisoli]
MFDPALSAGRIWSEPAAAALLHRLGRLDDCDSAGALAGWLEDFAGAFRLSGGRYVHLGHASADMRAEEGWRAPRWLEAGRVADAPSVHEICLGDGSTPFLSGVTGGREGESWLEIPVQDYAAGPAVLGLFGAARRAKGLLADHGPALMLAGARFHGAARRLLAGKAGALTDREIACLRLTAAGRTAGEIARPLGIARRTVEFHIGKAVRKLGAANRIHAVAIAVTAGLVRL